jgi:hypothetical protein
MKERKRQRERERDRERQRERKRKRESFVHSPTPESAASIGSVPAFSLSGPRRCEEKKKITIY